CNTRGLFSLGGGVGAGRLLGQLTGVHDKKTEVCYSQSPVRVFHFHWADDTVPVPVSRRLLAGTARFFEQERQRTRLLAPRLQFLPPPTPAQDHPDQAHPPLPAQPPPTVTIP